MSDEFSATRTEVTQTEPSHGSETTRHSQAVGRTSGVVVGSIDALKGVDGSEELVAQFKLWRGALTGDRDTRFELHSLLGQGAQGVVYRIHDHDTGRELALKTLRGSRHHARRLARFVREAQVTAQLQHPGVVPVHDLDVLPDGTVFYLMKQIEGSSLSQHLSGRRGREAYRFELLQIIQKICDTLAFAHSRGVVHRDLKPSNVMVGAYGEVLVVDWGLAKVIDGSKTTITIPGVASASSSASGSRSGESDDGSSLGPDAGDPMDPYRTAQGHAVGTPAYMSPEQAAGNSHQVDPRSDVYAVGVMLYEIVAGCSPYMQTDAAGVLAACRQGLIRPLVDDQHGDSIPRPLAAIITKAMALDPSRRYQSAAEVREDIQRYLGGLATTAYRESVLERLVRQVRRHRGPVIAASIAATLLIGAWIGYAVWQRHEIAERVEELRTWSATADAHGDLEAAQDHLRLLLELAPEDREATELLVDLGTRAELAAARAESAAIRETNHRQALTLIAEAEKLAESGLEIAKLEQAEERFTQALGLVDDPGLQNRALTGRDRVTVLLGDHEQRQIQQRADSMIAAARRAVGDDDWATARDSLARASALVSTNDAMTELDAIIDAGETAQRLRERQTEAASLLADAVANRAANQLQEALGGVRASIQLAPTPEATAELQLILEALSEAEAKERVAQRLGEADQLLQAATRAAEQGEGERAAELVERARGVAVDHPALATVAATVSAAQTAERRAAADELIERAAAFRAEAERCERGLLAANQRLRQAEDDLLIGNQPDRARATLQDALAEIDRLEVARNDALAEAVALLFGATARASDYPRARHEIADYFRDQVLAAQAVGDTEAAATAAAQGAFYDDEGRHQAVFTGIATVRAAAGGPALTLHRLVDQPGAGRVVSDDPLTIMAGGERNLPAGTYLVRKAGNSARRAINLVRGSTNLIEFASEPTLPDQLAWIPTGGIYDPDGRRLTWSSTTGGVADTVPGFALARREVTNAEWLEFLNDPQTLAIIDRREERRMFLAPRPSALAEESLWARESIRFGDGRFVLRHRVSDELIDPSLPVTGISRSDIVAYLAWRSARDGIAWRLPNDREWQLAAQCGDGRPFVWGRFPDLGLCASGLSTVSGGRPRLQPGGTFATDRTVHGVDDLGGSVAELVDTRWHGLQGVWIYRGGSWADRDPQRFRSTGRRGMDHRAVLPHVGFRLAASVRDGALQRNR